MSERQLLKSKIEEYQKQTKMPYSQILKELGMTMTLLRKAMMNRKELTPEEGYIIKRAMRYLEVVTGESKNLAQKDLFNLPTDEKEETIKQERKFIRFHQHEKVLGKEVCEMSYDPETCLYFIKPGYCRATEHQIYRALRNKTYAAKLAKACKLGDLTSRAGEC